MVRTLPSPAFVCLPYLTLCYHVKYITGTSRYRSIFTRNQVYGCVSSPNIFDENVYQPVVIGKSIEGSPTKAHSTVLRADNEFGVPVKEI